MTEIKRKTHTRYPPLNAWNLYWLSRLSDPSLSSHRSGLNCAASGPQTAGSRAIAQSDQKTCVGERRGVSERSRRCKERTRERDEEDARSRPSRSEARHLAARRRRQPPTRSWARCAHTEPHEEVSLCAGERDPRQVRSVHGPRVEAQALLENRRRRAQGLERLVVDRAERVDLVAQGGDVLRLAEEVEEGPGEGLRRRVATSEERRKPRRSGLERRGGECEREREAGTHRPAMMRLKMASLRAR